MRPRRLPVVVLCSIRARHHQQHRMPGKLCSARHRRRVQERGRCGKRDVRRHWDVSILPVWVLLARHHRQRLLQLKSGRRGQRLRAAAVRRCGPDPARLSSTYAGEGGTPMLQMRPMCSCDRCEPVTQSNAHTHGQPRGSHACTLALMRQVRRLPWRLRRSSTLRPVPAAYALSVSRCRPKREETACCLVCMLVHARPRGSFGPPARRACARIAVCEP